MSAPFPKKKPRGWKRRMRELDRWAAGHATPDMHALWRSDYHSAELWFERWPWPRPTAARRRMVQHLVEIHDRWLPRLQELDEPFYLGIWLLGTGLAGSQVVAAVGARAAEYRTRHDPARPSPPPALYTGFPRDLGRFEWTRHVWEERDRLSLYGNESWPELLRRARRVERVDGDVALTFAHEDWFARLPEAR